jgi:hypothetical protein
MRSVLTLETYIFTRDCASETQKQPGNAIHRDQRRASRPLESALPDHHIAATSTRPLYRHTQAQHEAAQGGTWRRPSAADTARCSDAHECMHTAMSSCSGPQHTAAEASRDAHDANKKSAVDADSAATAGPQRAESSSASPTVLAVVVVDAIEPARLKYDRSEAVLSSPREHP